MPGRTLIRIFAECIQHLTHTHTHTHREREREREREIFKLNSFAFKSDIISIEIFNRRRYDVTCMRQNVI